MIRSPLTAVRAKWRSPLTAGARDEKVEIGYCRPFEDMDRLTEFLDKSQGPVAEAKASKAQA